MRAESRTNPLVRYGVRGVRFESRGPSKLNLMLLTITNRREPATDLGYLLHKHPAKLQTYPLTFGDRKSVV